MERWRVTEGDAGERLDRSVARKLDAPRNQVQIWIREGLVEVDGKARRVSYSPSVGQEIVCTPRPKETAVNLEPEPETLSVLHEDEHVVVVDKPAGLAVHPGAGRPQGTLVNRLIARYPELSSVGGVDRPGIVHRLDIDTTGVLVVARSEPAYQALSRAFAERLIEKTYLGIVFGSPDPQEGSIVEPIARHPTRRREMAVRPDGRPSTTGYRVVAQGSGTALVELDLMTGRTHQIRVHLKAIHHPLVGDGLYAGNRWRGAPRPVQKKLKEFPRPALHAHEIVFNHPVDGGSLRLTAPIPRDLRVLWEAISTEPLPGIEPGSERGS